MENESINYFHLIKRDSFWTNKQRQGHSLNEISYRACFKPQLPQYFIEKYSKKNDKILDPFMGRGTTIIQTALHGRIAYGSDINPLSEILTSPRLYPPSLCSIANRLIELPKNAEITKDDESLLVFYHPKTLKHLLALKRHFMRYEELEQLTDVDKWIRMVIVNRLSGHSKGFLSVKTMPPNQTISIKSQKRLNEKQGLVPEEKDVNTIVIKKSKSLLRSENLPLHKDHKLRCCNATDLNYIADSEIDLVITSPPFMNIVNYAQDNWLRCWFAGIDVHSIAFDDNHAFVDGWRDFIKTVFVEFARVVKVGGHIAFEVGEIQKGSIKLEEKVIEAIDELPFSITEILINEQQFTKTAKCLLGVNNNEEGTNTNRIVVVTRI